MDYVKYNETDKFPIPFSGEAYPVVVSFDNKFKQEGFTHQDNLLECIAKLEADSTPFVVYGVWHGKWKTSLFVLEWNVLKQRIINMKARGEIK